MNCCGFTPMRKLNLTKLSYGVLYSIESNGLFILAVMNLHRDPDYWKHRR